MAFLPLVVVTILLFGKLGVQAACNECPAGEPAANLPVPDGLFGHITLIRLPPATFYGETTCNLRKPKTNIKIEPGQYLWIRRVVNNGVFRAIKLEIKVCKVTSIQAKFMFCRWNNFARPLKEIINLFKTINKEISDCQFMTFVLPVPPPGPLVKVDPTACGQTSLVGIEIRFFTKRKWRKKVKVQCVRLNGCLQNDCIHQ